MTDTAVLSALVLDILVYENAGERAFFEPRLADHLAMRRGNGVVIDRAAFLAAVAPGGDREALATPEVTLIGQDRALVRCRVRAGGRVIDNLLLFVRQSGTPEGWALLAWANEPAAA